MRSGKWGARVMHPISGVRVWLGSFDTAEEALMAYNKKKGEFEERFKSMPLEEEKIGGFDGFEGRKLPPGVRKRSGGKWGAQIWHPKLKISVKLGCFDTPEEAAMAVKKKSDLFKKRFGSGKWVRSGSKGLEEPEWGSISMAGSMREKVKFDDREIVLALAAPELPGNDTPVKETVANFEPVDEMNGECFEEGEIIPVGVKMTKSGRWGARVTNPICGTDHWLGSYKTLKEAVNAVNRKRAHFEKMSKPMKKRLMLRANNKVSYAPLEKPEHGFSHLSPTSIFEAENSNGAAASANESEGAEAYVEDEKKKPICISSFEEGVRLGVINQFGQLLGEYSKLDDLSFGNPDDNEPPRGIY